MDPLKRLRQLPHSLLQIPFQVILGWKQHADYPALSLCLQLVHCSLQLFFQRSLATCMQLARIKEGVCFYPSDICQTKRCLVWRHLIQRAL